MVTSVIRCAEPVRGLEWLDRKEKIERDLAEIESARASIRDRFEDEVPGLSYVRLWIWPYVLIFALMLKCAKTVATLAAPKVSLPQHTWAPSEKRLRDLLPAPSGRIRSPKKPPLRANTFR